MSSNRRDASRGCWWFVTRKYPPAVGGMERLSWEVTTRLGARRPLHVVAAHAQSLPIFMIASAWRLLYGCLTRRVCVLHLGDPVLAPLATIARAFGVPTAVTLHGLDTVHSAAAYRIYRRIFLRGFDAYVCISDAARRAAISVGILPARIRIIGIGVDLSPVSGEDRDDDRLLFIGRLVRRKGLEWFVRHVLPRIAAKRPSLRLFVLGDGPERGTVSAAADAARVAERLVWLGTTDDPTKVKELSRATICVMPNVPVDGDIEGFGIVALEAAAAGCPLIASRLEGLCDAVSDGGSGRLVEPANADAWVAALEEWLSDPAARDEAGRRAREHVVHHRGWNGIIDSYEQLLSQLADARRR